MGQSFELTKEGVKLSYLRFLSDSAGGFIMLLLLALAYSKAQPLPMLGDCLLGIIPPGMRPESKVFLFILSFLIATPLGLMLNGVSYFLLGAFSAWLVRVWELLPRKASFLIVGTRRSYHAEEIARFFGLRPWLTFPRRSSKHKSGGSLFDEAKYYEGVLSFYFPSYYEQLDHLRGLTNFVLSLALLALAVSLYCFFSIKSEHHILVAVLALMGSFLLVSYNSLLEYYQWLKTLFMTYTLSSDVHSSNPSRKQIIENLIELSRKLRSSRSAE